MVWEVIPNAIIWSLWKARNECVFKGIQPKWDELSVMIRMKIVLWVSFRSKAFDLSINEVVFNLRSIRDMI